MSFEQTLEYLYSLLPVYHRIGPAALKKDLINIKALCRKLGEPQNQFRSIHIAGTNGKGSVSSMISAILQVGGYAKVGLFTSPHLKCFTERIRVNGGPIPQQWVVDFVQEFKPAIEEIKPSFFELTTAMAFYYFAEQQVDYAVIEVGLGGRLDSTNVILPTLTVITSIGWDHMEFLGNSLAQIAYEKAGIIKPCIPVVIGEYHPETFPVFEKVAQEKCAPIYLASNNFQVRFHQRQDYFAAFEVWQGVKKWDKDIFCDLTASYQAQNIQTVLQAMDVFNEFLPLNEKNINNENILEGLSMVCGKSGLRGRWEIIARNPTIVLDIAHNEHGFRAILKELNTMVFESLHIVIGFVKEKKIETILPLLPSGAYYYLVAPQLPRALPVAELASVFDAFNLKYSVFASVVLGMEAARKNARPGDLILATGSLFVVAEVLP
jgi:dihydrofolate synthase/folylpolyglutamate synthase